VDTLAAYMRMIAIPDRGPAADAADGRALFEEVGCAVCHVPALHTADDYSVALLAGIDAPVYTDLLLHDLGAAMGDGLADEDAAATEWKTAPLVGLRFERNYLHDGRALTLDEAVEAHGEPDSEARDVIDAYDALSETDRARLLEFVGAL